MLLQVMLVRLLHRARLSHNMGYTKEQYSPAVRLPPHHQGTAHSSIFFLAATETMNGNAQPRFNRNPPGVTALPGKAVTIP